MLAGVRRDQDGDRLRKGASERLTPLRLDVTDETQIQQAASLAERLSAGGERFAGIVNNVGVNLTGPIEHLSVDDWRALFEVNFFGNLRITKAFLPILRRDRGRVVNIGSTLGRLSLPFGALQHFEIRPGGTERRTAHRAPVQRLAGGAHPGGRVPHGTLAEGGAADRGTRA